MPYFDAKAALSQSAARAMAIVDQNKGNPPRFALSLSGIWPVNTTAHQIAGIMYAEGLDSGLYFSTGIRNFFEVAKKRGVRVVQQTVVTYPKGKRLPRVRETPYAGYSGDASNMHPQKQIFFRVGSL